MTSVTQQLTPARIGTLLGRLATCIDPDAELLEVSWAKHRGAVVQMYDGASFLRAVDDLDLTVATNVSPGGILSAHGTFDGTHEHCPLTVVCSVDAVDAARVTA